MHEALVWLRGLASKWHIVTKSDLLYSNCYKVRLVIFKHCYKVRLVVFKLFKTQTFRIQLLQLLYSKNNQWRQLWIQEKGIPNLILDPHLHQMYINCKLQCCLLTEKSPIGTLYKVEKSTWHTLHSRKVYLAQFSISVAAVSHLRHPPAVVAVEVKFTNVRLSDTLLLMGGREEEARAKLRRGGCSAAAACAGGGVAAHVGVEVWWLTVVETHTPLRLNIHTSSSRLKSTVEGSLWNVLLGESTSVSGGASMMSMWQLCPGSSCQLCLSSSSWMIGWRPLFPCWRFKHSHRALSKLLKFATAFNRSMCVLPPEEAAAACQWHSQDFFCCPGWWRPGCCVY